MRQLLAAGFAAVLVVAVGVGAWVLLQQAEQDAPADDVAVGAAAGGWARAASAGDVEALLLLADERTDGARLARTVAELTAALGAPPTTEVVDVQSDGGTATATLRRAATLVPGGTWEWEVTLPLQRARGTWSVVWDPSAEHPQLREGWGIAVERSDPVRAPVLDRRGRTLSASTELVEIGVQPGRLPAEDRVLATVAGALPEAVVPLQELLARDDLEPDWFYRLVTVDAERADEVFPELLGVPGILRRPVDGVASTAAYAPSLLGSTVPDDDGTPRGATGLQLLLDERLDGSEVVEVQLLDADGGTRAVLATLQQDPSPPVVTTLDRDVQRAVQEVLLGEQGEVAVAVVDVAGGGLVATGSLPATGYARALEGRYPPGLHAGTVALAAALGTGTPADLRLDCPERAVVGGVTVLAPDVDTVDVPLRDVLAERCTTGLAGLALAAGGPALRDAADALGLALEPALVVDAAGWRWPDADADPAGLAAAAVGHGRATTSAVGAAALAGTVARGAPVTPHLLADDAPAPGAALPVDVAAPLADAWAAAGADGVVQVPGLRLAGLGARTGLVAGDPAPPTGWWVGWLADGGPEVAVAVLVEGDDGTRAATLARRLLRAIAS